MDLEYNYIVYCIKRPNHTNDFRRYIGVSHNSSTWNPYKRFEQHKVSKHRVGNFIRKNLDVEFHILFEGLTKEEAYRLESILVPKNYIERNKLQLLNERAGGDIPPSFYDFDIEKRKILAKKISLGNKKHYDNVINREKRRIEMLEYHSKNPHVLEERSKKRITHFQKNNLLKSYELIGPDEKIYTEKDMSIGQLAIKFNINQRCMYNLVNEKINWYKGFRLLKNKDYKNPNQPIKYCLIHEESGIIYEGENVNKFCKEHKLDSCYITRMVKGARGEGKEHYKRYKTHRGFKVFVK